MQDSAYNNAEIARFRNEVTRQLTTFNPATGQKTMYLPHGKKISLPAVAGQGYIAQLWITFPGWFWQHWNHNAAISQTILRTLILRIYWDDASEPAVEAPVGDFFGNGLCEISNFTSRYFGMSSGGFFCKFPMPFAKGFRIEFENLDATINTDIFANVLYQLTDAPLAETGYFHAQFHTATNPGPEPVVILDAKGRGHFVGCTLATQGKDRHYLSFLEAPEYVYVDGETDTPTIVGTGLEDYFLGGWYFREGEFAGELHGVPSKDALNSSVAMYRIHEADAIRFKKSLRFTFVNPWKPERLQTFMYSSAGFYYLDSPEGQEPKIKSGDDLIPWYRVRDIDHLSVP